jgi:hypothetical protein
MGIIDRAQKDITRITSNPNGFGVPIQFISPSGQTVNVIGMHTEIWYDVNTEGNVVNTKLANVAVSNQTLINAGYPFRDSNGVVNFKKHLVNVQNVSGNTLNYDCKSWHPDEQTGLILIFLNSYIV